MPQPAPGAPSDRPRTPPPPTALSTCALVLCRTQGPINLGMVARLCGNLGVADLRLVAPACDVDVPDARRFSTHNREQLLRAPIFPDLPAATADCGLVVGTSGDFRVGELGAPVPVQELPALLARRRPARWALVFGCESDGLDDAELRACNAWVHLDTYGDNPSYNLANSVAICLYLIAMQSAAGRPAEPAMPEAPAATRAQVAELEAFWLATLDRFQYFQRTDRARFQPLFARFLARQDLTARDAGALRGMLAQFHYFAFGDRGLPARAADPDPAQGGMP